MSGHLTYMIARTIIAGSSESRRKEEEFYRQFSATFTVVACIRRICHFSKQALAR